MQIKDLVEEVRSRIAKVEEPHLRFGLMANYLGGCRSTEVVSRSSKYGWRSEDVREAAYNNSGVLEPLVIFTIRMAKARERVAKERYVALPLDQKYEPWAKPLYDYCKNAKGPVFPYTRRTLCRASAKAFKGLSYDIEGYYDGSEKISAHERDAASHFLRHVRASELRMLYHFQGENLSDYGGWLLPGSGKVSKSLGRYSLIPDWHGYFHLLLVPRDQL